MKKLLLVPGILFAMNSFAQGYRCEGYCGGINAQSTAFYDAGYITTEFPGDPDLGFKALISKCQKRIPKGAQAKIYRNLEITSTHSSTMSSGSSSGYGATVYSGYYWYQIVPYQYNDSYYYRSSEDKKTIKVDSLLSTDSCHYDPSIKVPTYEGDLPVQG